MKLCILAFTFVSTLQAAEVRGLKVEGDNQAVLQFQTDGALPKLNIDGNRVELVFAGTALADTLAEAGDVHSPHALVQRVHWENENGTARARITVNGSAEKLRDRVKLQKTGEGVALTVSYAAGADAAFKLLQEEQETIGTNKPVAAEAKGGFGFFRLMLILILFAATAGAAWLFLKNARKKSPWKSSRKHLIETVAQTSLGDARTSVAILRVGSEFVMVGVTPNNVNFLSALPKLSAQYEEESALERDSFKEAMAEQSRKGVKGLSV